MFHSNDIIGWIGGWAVIPVKGGVWLVEWGSGKRTFIEDGERSAK